MTAEALAEFREITDQHLADAVAESTAAELAARRALDDAVDELRAAGENLRTWLAAEAAHHRAAIETEDRRRHAAAALAGQRRAYLDAAGPAAELDDELGEAMRTSRADLGQLLIAARCP